MINVILLVSGQMLWKVKASAIKKWTPSTIIELMTSPYFIGGGLLYVIATFIWMYVLSKIPFSVAYPFQSLSYVLGVLAAYYLFQEHVGASQWLGLAIIIFGVYLIAK